MAIARTRPGAAALLAAALIGAGCSAPTTGQRHPGQPAVATASDVPSLRAVAAMRLPDARIPDALFEPADGSRYFDEVGTRVLGQRGDWFFVATSSPECALPVPSGWTTVETGADTYILFSRNGSRDQADIRVRLSIDGYSGDTRTSSDVLATFERELAAEVKATVVQRQVIDVRRGYALLSVRTESGRPRYLLEVFSRDHVEGYFFVYSVFTDTAADWPEFYPIIREMVANWVDVYGRSLGPPLPDSLPG